MFILLVSSALKLLIFSIANFNSISLSIYVSRLATFLSVGSAKFLMGLKNQFTFFIITIKSFCSSCTETVKVNSHIVLVSIRRSGSKDRCSVEVILNSY